MSDVMSTAAFGFSPRIRRRLSISIHPSLELAGDSSNQLVGESLHIGGDVANVRIHQIEADDTWNGNQEPDDRRHKRGGNGRRNRGKIGRTFGPHCRERIQDTPDGAKQTQHRGERDDCGNDAHAALDAQLLLVEGVLACALDEFDFTRSQGRRARITRPASRKKRPNVRRKQLEQALA